MNKGITSRKKKYNFANKNNVINFFFRA